MEFAGVGFSFSLCPKFLLKYMSSTEFLYNEVVIYIFVRLRGGETLWSVEYSQDLILSGWAQHLYSVDFI